MLLIAAGLIVAFRAGIWNLGGDGQFLLAAVITAALGPALITVLPRGATLVICMIASMAVGAIWSLVPAILKARYGVNEIITSLMMSFLGTSFANVLVKLFFWDPGTTVPQTRDLPVDDRLPRIFDTTIHSGLIIAVVVVILVHLMMTRTSFGLKLQVVGANPRRRGPCRAQCRLAHRRHLRPQRRAHRACGLGGDPGRLGHGAGGLESGLWPAGGADRLSRPLQRLCRDRLHPVLLGA